MVSYIYDKINRSETASRAPSRIPLSLSPEYNAAAEYLFLIVRLPKNSCPFSDALETLVNVSFLVVVISLGA